MIPYEGPRELIAKAAALEKQGNIADAIVQYQHLLDSWPGLPDCWFNLGLLQRRQGLYQEALVSYKEALERNVSFPEEVHVNRAVVYSDGLQQPDAAERELRKALSVNPDYIPALVNYANLYEDTGHRELAAKVYERVLLLKPDDTEALARYANLHEFSEATDPLIARLRELLAKTGLGSAPRASLGFALGRALDACGAYDAAFDAYRTANRDSRDSAAPGMGQYDLTRSEAMTRAIIRTFPASVRTTPKSRTPPTPIFICGMFRSGSTLTEQLLAGHPRITAGGELDYFPRLTETALAPFPQTLATLGSAQREELVAGYRSMLTSTFPHADFVTDKRPDNFLRIGLIKSLFPDAKIVHTTRDALDNCLSIYFLHLDQSMGYALDLMDIGHYYRQYRQLMAHWKILYGADVIDVSYESLVLDPRGQLEPVLKALGLEWHERCLAVPPVGRAVKTASAGQVRQPLYRKSVGRAENYRTHLEQMQRFVEAPL